MTARRLLLSTTALELLRQRALPAAALPPGFGLEPTGDGSLAAAEALLLRTGAAVPAEPGWAVPPAVAGDLHVLARPDLAVTVRATRPGLEVHACLALSGPRGAGLLRTGDTAVQLSSFRAAGLADELARVVPAPLPGAADVRGEVPLDVLLDGGSRRHARATGTLVASVVTGDARVVGSVSWVWQGEGWSGLEALPARAGRPWVRLVPVQPADLGAWVAPLLARAAA